MAATATAPQPARKPRLLFILPALMLAMGIGALDGQIVNTALPRISAELGGVSHISWIVTSFLLCQTCTMPLYGKLSDLYGRRLLFAVAIVIFLIGSALCGLAQSMLQLILFRGVQGLGAGGLYTLVSVTIGDFVEPRDRGKYQGYFTGVFVMCTVAGPVVGGLLTSAFGWRSVFYINLPLGLIVLGALMALLPSSPRTPHRIDFEGAGLVAIATTPLLLALSWGGSKMPWTSPVILGLGLFSAATYALLVWHERRAAEPILGIPLLNIPAFRWGVLTCGLVGFAFYGSNVFMPLYFQVVLGMTPALAGVMVLPQVLGNLTASLAGGQWISRSGRYRATLVGGTALLTAGFAAVALLSGRPSPLWMFEVTLFLLGLGGNLCFLSLTVTVQNAVERNQLGVATSSMTFFNSLLGAAGVALFGTLVSGQVDAWLNGHGQQHVDAARIAEALRTHGAIPVAISDAYRHAISFSFMVSTALNLLTLAAALKVPQISLTRDKTPVEAREASAAA